MQRRLFAGSLHIECVFCQAEMITVAWNPCGLLNRWFLSEHTKGNERITAKNVKIAEQKKFFWLIAKFCLKK